MHNSHLIQHFKAVISVYVRRGFRVTLILADNQFESLRDDLADLHVHLNITARDEHVPEIERFHRTIQERVRAIYNTLPFKKVPQLLVAEMINHAVYWRNMFPLKGGISTTESPSELVLNRKLDYNKHCQLEFGEYVQTHEESDNTTRSRTVGAIATRPSTGGEGGYYFISLSTGRRIHRRSYTRLPMPGEVVDQMHRLARRANSTLTFTNSNNEDLDVLYADLDRDVDDLPLAAEITGVVDDEDTDDEDSNYEPNPDETDEEDEETSEEEEESDENEPLEDEIPGVDNDSLMDDNEPMEDEAEIQGVPEQVEDEIPGVPEQVEDETPGVQAPEEPTNHERTYQVPNEGHTMNLRPQPKKEYNVFLMDGEEIDENEELVLLTFSNNNEDGLDETDIDELDAAYMFLTETLGWKEGLPNAEADDNPPLSQKEQNIAEYLFATEQMNWRKGLKQFGEKGEGAIEKELQQIHDMEGFEPKHWHELTKDERAGALKYLMYLKEKRDGRIKGRGCADGRPQRLYTSKVDTSSPTASTTGILLTCMIDSYEGKDVATVDIPGAFLQTKMPDDEKDIHVVLDGRMAELLANISPETYQEYVHYRRGQAFIYCKLKVALYGTLKAALLFWKKLSTFLVETLGFTINPYDWCIANKMINGKQCTIAWHVDDLKISHIDSTVVDEIIASLKKEYGKVGELTVRRGKIHDLTIDFSDFGKFMVDMEEYLGGVLENVPEDMDGHATTPAADHLFKTRDSAAKLDRKTAVIFHRITAQLLFVSQRGRPDLRTAVSFLTKRVKSPDEDDYKKLARAIKYIRRTKFLRLTIEATYLDQNHWFIDGAFAVHDDMKSHTGAYMTFGKGMLCGSSSGQKINTTSSTEAEVVAVHENMPAILWTRYFLEAQGYPLKPSMVHQDNQSAMLLETNGRGSSSKRTRHMNIRYFFVADVQKRNEINLKYCPTDEMIGDFFTKPLGGAKFRRFRNIIMNISHDEHGPVDVDELTAIHYAKMQEKIRFEENKSDDEFTINDITMTSTMNSQECVGDRKHSGDSHKPTYAEVAGRQLPAGKRKE